MSTPKWQPGTLYQPGALVVPATSNALGNGSLQNGNFESGNSGWTLDAGCAIQNTGGRAYQGTWYGTFGSWSGANRTIINNVRAPVTPGQPIHAAAFVNLDGHSNTNGFVAQRLYWYDSNNILISFSDGAVLKGGGNNYRQSTVSDAAPAGAAFASTGFVGGSSAAGPVIDIDTVSWNYVFQAPVDALTYEATQANAATSGTSEPVWPLVVGGTVNDGGVTWTAVEFSRLVWEAAAIMTSGAVEPVWPTLVGASVGDNAQIGWVATARQITDVKAPPSKVVVIGAAHVFAGDNDIVPFSAAVNPLDWTTPNDAGYLPTGLQNYGQNPVAAMALYRGNLMVFNAGGYQSWQIDPDPANMAFLDGQPVGSTYSKALQAVGNDLLFLSAVGVRNIGIAGASTNLQAAGVGNAVDPLVLAAIKALAVGAEPISLYNPGRGQYWLFFGPQAFVLTSYGPGRTSWARYVFSETITYWTLLGDELYLRTDTDKVWHVDEAAKTDDITTSTITVTIATPGVVTLTLHGFQNGDPVVLSTTGTLPTGLVAGTTYYIVAKTTNTFELAATVGGTAINTTGSQSGVHTAVVTPAAGLWTGVMWWPFVDFGNMGIDKNLIGFDVVGTGIVDVAIGYDQRDFNTLTTPPYTIDAADTVVGEPIPFPMTAPSFSLQLTFAANQAWEWNASNLYINDQKPYAGGTTG